MKKAYILIIIIIIFVVSGCFSNSELDKYVNKINDLSSNQTTDASWDKSYEDLESLITSSDLIVTGKVINLIPEKRIDLVFTKEVVEIRKVLKGDVKKGDTVEVLFTGGEIDNTVTASIEDAPLMDLKNQYVLFLELTPEGHYLVSGGFQGYSKIVNDEFSLTKVNQNDQKLKKLNLLDIEEMLQE